MSVFKNFPGLENLEKNSRTFDLQEPCRRLTAQQQQQSEQNSNMADVV